MARTTNEPKTHTFSPQLSESSFATHSDQGFVAKATAKKGIVDTSTAETINYLGNQALDAHKGYREAQMELDTEAEVDSFTDRHLDGGNAEQQLSTYANSDVGFSQEERDQLEIVKNKAEQVRKARINGAANTTELNIRLQKIAKEHIAAWPGLADNFRKILNDVKGDNKAELDKIINMEKSAATLAKEQAANEKLLRTTAEKMGIPGAILRPLEDVAAEYMIRSRERDDVLELERAAEMNEAIYAKIASDPLKLQQFSRGSTLLFRENLNDILAEPTDEGGLNNKLNNLASAYSIALQNAHALVGTNKPGALDAHKLVLTEIYNNAKDVATNKQELDYVTAKAELLRKWDELGLMQDPTYVRLMTLSPMYNHLDVGKRGLLDQSIKAKLSGFFSNINSTKGSINPFPSPDGRSEEDNKAISEVAIELNKWANQVNGISEDSPDKEIQVEVIMNTVKGVVNNWHKGERVSAFDSLMDIAANKDMHKFLTEHDTNGAVRERIEDITMEYIDKAVTKSFSGKFNIDTMSIGTTNEGIISITPNDWNDPQNVAMVNDIEKNYLSRFNKYVKVTSHMGGNQDYAGLAATLAAKLVTIGQMTKENTREDGTPDVTNASQVNRGNVDRFVRIVREKNESGFNPGLSGEGPSKGAAYAIVPSFYDLYYGEDVNDWEVFADQMGQIWNSIDYTLQGKFLTDIANLPFFNAFWAGLEEDKNGNRVYWSRRERKERGIQPSATNRIGADDISNDISTVPKGNKDSKEEEKESNEVVDFSNLESNK